MSAPISVPQMLPPQEQPEAQIDVVSKGQN
jgi:hypothetical protein